MEQLNSEHGDLQQLILSLQQEAKDINTSLSTTVDERDNLQDSLEETNQLCLELESRLSDKREKERMLEDSKVKIETLEELLAEANKNLASAGLAQTEKENALTAMADMETKHQETLTGLHKQISDSTSQVSKLINQLSTTTNEKAAFVTDLAATKDLAEHQKQKISQLETAIVTLGQERDTASARVSELLEGNKQLEQELASLASSAEKSKSTIDRLENTIKHLQTEADATKSEKDTTVSYLSAMENETEVQRAKIAQLESSIKSLTAERDAANAAVLAGSNSAEQVLSSLASTADERKMAIDRLEAEKANLLARTLKMESTIKDLQQKNSNGEGHKVEDQQDKLKKLNSELINVKDKNVALQEAIQVRVNTT